MMGAKTPLCLIGDKLPVRRIIAKELTKEHFAVAGSFDGWDAFASPDRVILKPEVILVLALDPDSQPERHVASLTVAFPEADVVVLGDVSSRERADACVDAGASGYLAWPISANKLVHLLRFIMAGEEIVMAKSAKTKKTAETQDDAQHAVSARPEAPLSDQRRSPRRRVLKKGRFALDDGRGDIDCTVLDMSETGAQPRASRANRIPRNFTLKLDGAIGNRGSRCEIDRRVLRRHGRQDVELLRPGRVSLYRIVHLVSVIADVCLFRRRHQELAQQDGAIPFHISRREHEGYLLSGAQRAQCSQRFGVLRQLIAVAGAKFGPQFGAMPVPLTQLRRRGNVLHPMVNRGVGLGDPARPQPFDKDA